MSEDSAVLFMNIHQALSYSPESKNFPTDFERRVICSTAHSHGGDEVSYLSIEFKGARAKFQTFVTFDGTGDFGVSLRSLIMPGKRLSPIQRAMILLSILQYACAKRILRGDIATYTEQFEIEHSCGTGSFAEYFRILNENSQEFVAAKREGKKLLTYKPFWLRVPKVVYDSDSPSLASA